MKRGRFFLVKIGINGFGRIGKLVFRVALERAAEFQVVGVNDPFATPEHMAYIVKHDTTYGRCFAETKWTRNTLDVDAWSARVSAEREPAEINWRACGAEYVVDATGIFTSLDAAKGHLVGGAKKVVISAPAKDDETPTFVCGVNLKDYDVSMDVVSNASCTTNCIAPLATVIHRAFGISEGLLTTVHAATATQRVVDGVCGRDWRLGRATLNNIIPATTGAARACGKVVPELAGRLTGIAFRVPTLVVSAVDATLCLQKATSYDEICKEIKRASVEEMKGVIGYVDDAVVSSDFIGDKRTCIFDARAGIMLSGRFVKLVAWYDNEWGYCNKLLDLIDYINQKEVR
ncbi:MAG: type I glyceraldehyde-3-phosphate dehydrogenase [Oscillospiraceae bacterium]|nr:type I glyceraldehyde-3-phosphate dehydrogenase [Oscillospiraceae bacterium]